MKITASKDLFKRGHTDIVINVSETKNDFDLILKQDTARKLAVEILEALK